MSVKQATSTTYFWVAMRGESTPVILARVEWTDGYVEWVRPGSFSLWIPDKDFMILEKVPDYKPFAEEEPRVVLVPRCEPSDPGTRTTLGLFWE